MFENNCRDGSVSAGCRRPALAGKKGHELQRQGSPHPLRHSLALFVYTYEMVTTEPTDQDGVV